MELICLLAVSSIVLAVSSIVTHVMYSVNVHRLTLLRWHSYRKRWSQIGHHHADICNIKTNKNLRRIKMDHMHFEANR